MNNKQNSYVKTAMYKIVPLYFSKVISIFHPNGHRPNFPLEILESTLLANNANRIIWVNKTFNFTTMFPLIFYIIQACFHRLIHIPISRRNFAIKMRNYSSSKKSVLIFLFLSPSVTVSKFHSP